MTRDINDGSQWERVAAELRACREAQQRAWGDIDNTTLGRYLAGEVTTEEHEQIEQALNELPELRKLTDLVRDVLSETEAAVEQPEAVPYRPATLPFPQPPMRAAASAGPVRPAGWKSRRLAPHLRQWVGLAAAASVLFVLGVAFPRSPGVSAPQAELALTLSQPVAMRDVSFSRAMPADDPEMIGQLGGIENGGEPFKHEKLLVARIDASLKALQAEGHKHEAERLARQYADNLTRKALSYQEKGDLIRAEPALQEARQLCVRVWGLQAPETVRSSNSLAEVYEVALNVTPPNPYTYAGAYTENPYAGGTGYGGPTYSAGVHDPTRAPFAAYSMSAPPPGDKPPAVHSSSSYEPNAAHPRSAPPGAMAKKAPTKELFRRSGQQVQVQAARMMANRSYTASTASLVALRDRLTSQSQSELKTSVVPVLTQALREATNSEERQRLARALGQLGPAARDAVPVLLDCCRQARDTTERASMLLVLGEIGPTAAPEAVPVLVESLQTDSPAIRDCAARALVQLGPAARHDCRQELVQHSKDDLLVRDVLLRLDGPEGRCGINDESECFSVKVIQETRQEIHQLAATYRIAIGIETTPDKVVVVPHAKDGRNERFQGDWMFERKDGPTTVAIKNPDKTRVRIVGDRTVYFHINKDAGDAQVFVSDALQKQGLSNAQLRHVLKTHLSKKDYDGAVREAIQVVARFEKEKSAKK
jgi:hypothetical protein